MAKTLRALARRELIDAVRARYRIATRAETRVISREVTGIAAYHQKSPIPSSPGSSVRTPSRPVSHD